MYENRGGVAELDTYEKGARMSIRLCCMGNAAGERQDLLHENLYQLPILLYIISICVFLSYCCHTIFQCRLAELFLMFKEQQ